MDFLRKNWVAVGVSSVAIILGGLVVYKMMGNTECPLTGNPLKRTPFHSIVQLERQ